MKKKDNSKIWDSTYTHTDPSDLPWHFETPKRFFTSVIKSGWVKPCRALELGCGLGTYSYYLAKRGFKVCATDYSEVALNIARNRNSSPNIEYKKISALDISRLKERFDFIFEISVLHHISPKDRERYVNEIYLAANKKAKILICCFSEKEKFFDGKAEFRNPETKTVTYPLSEKELINLFEEKFKIVQLKKISFGKVSRRQRFLLQMVRK